MSEDRMRAEFEVWLSGFLSNADMEDIEKARSVQNGNSVYIFDYDDEATMGITAMWVAWQASRAALEIELPKPVAPDCPECALDDSWMDGYNAALRMRESCVNGIEAAGVRVKK